MEDLREYFNMQDDFYKVLNKNQEKLSITGKSLNFQEIKCILFPGKEAELSPEEEHRLQRALKEHGFEEKAYTLEDNIECLIPVQLGKEIEIAEKIMEYCRTAHPSITFDSPDILQGQVRIRIASKEDAEKIRNDFASREKNNITTNNYSWAVDKRIMASDKQDHIAKIMEKYLEKTKSSQDINMLGFYNLEKTIHDQKMGNDINKEVGRYAGIGESSPGKEMTSELSQLLDKNADEIKKNPKAYEEYKKNLTKIFNKPGLVTKSDFHRATLQITSAHFTFDPNKGFLVKIASAIDHTDFFEINPLPLMNSELEAGTAKASEQEPQEIEQTKPEESKEKFFRKIPPTDNGRSNTYIDELKKRLSFRQQSNGSTNWPTIDVDVLRKILKEIRESKFVIDRFQDPQQYQQVGPRKTQ